MMHLEGDEVLEKIQCAHFTEEEPEAQRGTDLLQAP